MKLFALILSIDLRLILFTFWATVTTLRSPYGMSRPSSIVCDVVAPYSDAMPNSLGTRAVCIKILGKNSKKF